MNGRRVREGGALEYSEHPLARRSSSLSALCLPSLRRFSERNTPLSSTGGPNGSSYIENTVSCIFLGFFLARLPFHLLYEGEICCLLLLDRSLGRFKLWMHISLLCVTKGGSERTLRFTPFNFFSPSRTLSNLPMLAVLTREVASVLFISFFRWSFVEGPAAVLSPWARAVFCAIRRSFLTTRAFRSALAILEGS